MSDILKKIVAAKRLEVAALKRERPFAEVRADAKNAPPAGDFPGALRGPRPRGKPSNSAPGEAPAHIIAEIKRRSPSKGEFPFHGDVERQARDYARGGARAISVVTDGPFFGGSAGLLATVRKAVKNAALDSPLLPVLQKDFLLEPWQVFYARALGADACLLIAALLPAALMGEMTAAAREAGIHVLVEVTDEEEFRIASEAGAVAIGVNNRDLKTFTVDPARTERLLPLYRDRQICIAESGIRSREDVRRLLAAGVDGFLIGEALMTASDPAALLRALRGEAPREAAS